MTHYILEVCYQEKAHKERYTSFEQLEFERESDISAFRYAFSSSSIDAPNEEKNCIKCWICMEAQKGFIRKIKEK